MGFGCSYSLVAVDCIDFVKTAMWKKLIRAALGVGIAILVNYIFGLLAETGNNE